MRNKMIITKMKAWNGMEAAKRFLHKKVDGVSGFVVTLILVAVACAVGVIFKDQLGTIFTTLFGKMNTVINNLF